MWNENHLSGGAGAVLPRGPKDPLAGCAEASGRENVFCVTAGVPCQDVSVAGKRAGLAGERTGLFYEFARVLREVRPHWFIFENVPGLLSSNRGRDFAEVLRVLMVECGYGLSWRVLDSQYFGVAQRRRRLFIVGRFGKPCPAEILFESEGGEGNPAKGSEARSRIAAPLTSGSGVTGNAPGRRREDDENLAYCLREDPGGIGQGHNTTYAVTENMRNRSQGPANYVTGPLNTRNGHSINAEDAAGSHIVAAPIAASRGHHGHSSERGDGSDNLIAHPITQSSFKRHDEDTDTLVAATINSGGNGGGFRSEPGEHIVIQDVRGGTRDRTDDGQGIGIREGGPSYTLSKTEQHAVAYALPSEHRGIGNGHNTNYVSSPPDSDGVRDFAGLPEGLDSARYRALGNAVTVQVIFWIGQRIIECERERK